MTKLLLLLALVANACMPGAGPAPSFPDATTTSDNTGPQMVVPATGGVPVLATPLGGDTYLPVTGGPPITGISTSP